MEKSSMTTDQWLQYIMKLNDRALVKRRSSGFTTWAICGIIVLIFYRIIDTIPSIIIGSNIKLFLIILTNTMNIFVTFFFIIVSIYLRCLPISEMRLTTSLSRTIKPLIFSPIIVLIAGLVFLNLWSFINKPSPDYPRWPYIFIIIISLTNIVFPLIFKMKSYWKMRNVYKDLPIIDIHPFFSNQSYKNPFINGIIIGSTILFIFSLIPFIFLLKIYPIIDLINFYKISLEISVFLFLIIILLLRLSNLLQYKFFENLERNILVEELNVNEIRDIFILEFLGETVHDWFNKVEDRLKELLDLFNNSLEEANKNLNELSNIDKTYSYEIKGRKKDICDKVQINFDNYMAYAENVMKYLKFLTIQYAHIVNPELFKEIINISQTQLDNIKFSFKSLCDKCQSIKPTNNSCEDLPKIESK